MLGRVWAGEDAKAKGLVDELGGYDVALRLAREAAKIPADKPFKLVVFPRKKSTLDLVYDRLFDVERDSDDGAPSAAQGLLGQPVAAGVAQALSGIATLIGDPGVLRMPPIGELR